LVGGCNRRSFSAVQGPVLENGGVQRKRESDVRRGDWAPMDVGGERKELRVGEDGAGAEDKRDPGAAGEGAQ
jgi:hypothetical protein